MSISFDRLLLRELGQRLHFFEHLRRLQVTNESTHGRSMRLRQYSQTSLLICFQAGTRMSATALESRLTALFEMPQSGFAGSAISWVWWGCLDILITWKACTRQDDFRVPNAGNNVVFILLILSLLLSAITVAAAVASYRNWRPLSTKHHILNIDAIERPGLMALRGVIESVALGLGICWLALPPLLLDLGWRAL